MSARRKRLCTIVAVFLLAVAFMGRQSPAALNCGSCHGMPPKDEPVRNPVTHGFQGNHQTHLPAIAKANDCAVCHGDSVTGYGSGHRDRVIGLSTNINASPAVASYSKGTFFNQTSLPLLGSCTNVNCHFETATPSWGNSPVLTTCSTCHGVPPADGTHPFGAQKHGVYYGTGTASCANCHPDHFSDANMFAHATSAGKRGLLVQFSLAPNRAGSYSADVTYPAYLPSKSQSRTGTCSGLYCHSNGSNTWTGPYPAPAQPAVWGSTIGCNGCHGNSSYAANDYRAAAPMYPNGGANKSNAHQLHVRGTGSSALDPSCAMCHYGVTTDNSAVASTALHLNKSYDVQGSGANIQYPLWGGGAGANGNVTFSYAFNAAGSSCSTVSCHPAGLSGATTTKWSNAYSCTDCHNINLINTSGYHHAMDASAMADRSYPLYSSFANVTSLDASRRKCTICHVDHDVFSATLNAGNSTGRAANLRASIVLMPVAGDTTTYAGSDYSPTGGGICISCHNNAFNKSASGVKQEPNSRHTPVVTLAGYSGSRHQYALAANLANGGGAFQANCSKCHNSRSNETTNYFQNRTTASHDGGTRRLLAPLGLPASDSYGTNFCYRCHSRANDTNPGGGPAKPTAGKDYFGAVSMSAASEAFYSMQRYYLTTTLYFRETVPTSPAPVGTGSSDTFQGGTWQGRDMLPLQGVTPQAQTVTITDAGNPRYWRMTSFISPPVSGPTTIPAAPWSLTVWGFENNAGANAYLRGTIYVWTAAGTKGALIAPPTSLNDESVFVPGDCDDEGCWSDYWYVVSHELTASDSPYGLSLSGSQVTLNTGDRIVVEVEVDSSGALATSYTATYRWNGSSTYDSSRIVIPQAVSFSWFPPTASSHRVDNYNGTHKSSPSDETRAYLSVNKHVECGDCHNTHAAKAGTHVQGTTAVANVTRGVDGVSSPSWPSAWTTPTFDDVRGIASNEWQICFKCHSSYNTNLNGWNANWTDLAKEFNPNNPSYHAVIGASRLPNQGSFVNGWAYNSVVTCSDCHGNNLNGLNYPKGPHVSANGVILKGDGRSGALCFNCHSSSFTNSGFSGPDGELHDCHYNFCGGGVGPLNCYTCHSKIPHGAPRPRLFVLNGDDPRYLDPSTGHENSWSQNTGNYGGGECSGYCH